MTKEGQPAESPDPGTNRLLASLEPADYKALMRTAKVVHLKLHQRLQRQDKPIEAVYFPITCMVSLLVSHNEQAKMELATVGREGVVGASELIQTQRAMGLHLIQLPGTAVRIEAAVFRKVIQSRPQVLAAMNQHLYALMRQILYGAACNRMHSMEERCARWLLMTHDRAAGDTFPLTQEFLSHMLGVRRATVNLATGMLKKAGLIRYVRGVLTVVDRRGLEAASCECYQDIIRIYDSILSKAPEKKNKS